MKRRPKTPATTATRKAGANEKPATLGELLYAGRAGVPVPEQDWAAVVRAIASGDQSALRALFDRTHRLVFQLTMRITGNRETAEELCVDVFHDVWRRAAQYDPANGSVLGWIMNQARSRAIDRVRHERRQKRVDPFAGRERLSDAEAQDADAQDAAAALDRNELARRLRLAVAILTPDERQAIEATYFSDMTYAEAAAHLNAPLGTLKTRIRSGLGKLRVRFPLDDKDEP